MSLSVLAIDVDKRTVKVRWSDNEETTIHNLKDEFLRGNKAAKELAKHIKKVDKAREKANGAKVTVAAVTAALAEPES